jgi:hypothetical protein
MVGRPGTAYLVVDVKGIHLAASGEPLRSSAGGSLILEDFTWTTAGISCVRGRCASEAMKTLPGTSIAEAPMSALPEVLELKIDRQFSIESGSGSIGMEFRGVLRGVVVVAGIGVKSEGRARGAITRLSRSGS